MKSPKLPGSDLSFGVKLGQSCDNNDEAVRDVLEGTANLENIVQGFAKLTWLSPVGLWSSSVNWLPIDVDYDDPGRADEEYNALKVSFDYTIGGEFSQKLLVFATIGTSWMNDEYAEAFHSVFYPTAELEVFEAENSISDVHGMLGVRYAFSSHIGGVFLLSGEQLLGDTAESPLTKREFQPSAVAVISWAF